MHTFTRNTEMAKDKKGKSVEAMIPVPDGVELEVDGELVRVKGSRGELVREFRNPRVTINKKDSGVTVKGRTSKRPCKAIVGTTAGHIKNMIKGVVDGIEYKLKIVYSHFPMNVKVQGNQLSIENFLGERFPRKATILKDVTVDVKGQDVTVTGFNKEGVSQTAANIEQATKIKGYDPRVFQDGIYITEKDGKPVK